MKPQDWPKLSETLPHPRHPAVCQSCGRAPIAGAAPHEIHIEHDAKDQPTAVPLILCHACAERLIEPHPRLYAKLPLNKPFPGTMPHLCAECPWRRDLSCEHPSLKSNGGPGLNIICAVPIRGFWDGTGKGGKRTGGPLEIYSTPARDCAGLRTPR